MLDAPEALFLGGSDKDTVTHERGGGVTMEGIETKDVHVPSGSISSLHALGHKFLVGAHELLRDALPAELCRDKAAASDTHGAKRVGIT